MIKNYTQIVSEREKYTLTKIQKTLFPKVEMQIQHII